MTPIDLNLDYIGGYTGRVRLEFKRFLWAISFRNTSSFPTQKASSFPTQNTSSSPTQNTSSFPTQNTSSFPTPIGNLNTLLPSADKGVPQQNRVMDITFNQIPASLNKKMLHSERVPIITAKTEATTLSLQLRKNTWINNMPSQISTKPNHCSRCTEIKQHLEHQNPL